jgi:hypothetical protein
VLLLVLPVVLRASMVLPVVLRASMVLPVVLRASSGAQCSLDCLHPQALLQLIFQS